MELFVIVAATYVCMYVCIKAHIPTQRKEGRISYSIYVTREVLPEVVSLGR